MPVLTAIRHLFRVRWEALAQIMVTRLLLLVVLSSLLTLVIPNDSQAFYAFVALAFVINIPYALWLRRDATARGSAPLQFLCDVVIVTGLVHFTGGMGSELFMLYPLIIISAGIVVSSNHAFKIATLSACLFCTLCVLEYRGVLEFRGGGAYPYGSVHLLLQHLGIRVFLFFFFSLASRFLGERCIYQDRQLARYQELIETMFDHLAVGLLTVSTQGVVLIANKQAGIMTGLPPAKLVGRTLASLFAGDTPDLKEDQGAVWSLLRPDLPPLPVGITHSTTQITPRGTGDAVLVTTPPDTVHFLTMRDLTKELQASKDLQRLQSLEVAFQVGFELAHEVRNPLTAVQCGCEGICTIAMGAQRGQALDAGEIDAIETLAEIVAGQVKQVNQGLDTFLLHLTENPAKMLEKTAAARELYCPKDDLLRSIPSPERPEAL